MTFFFEKRNFLPVNIAIDLFQLKHDNSLVELNYPEHFTTILDSILLGLEYTGALQLLRKPYE